MNIARLLTFARRLNSKLSVEKIFLLFEYVVQSGNFFALSRLNNILKQPSGDIKIIKYLLEPEHSRSKATPGGFGGGPDGGLEREPGANP